MVQEKQKKERFDWTLFFILFLFFIISVVAIASAQATDTESLGGESMHTRTSGVAHYSAKDDPDCLAIIRRLFRDMQSEKPAATAPADTGD